MSELRSEAHNVHTGVKVETKDKAMAMAMAMAMASRSLCPLNLCIKELRICTYKVLPTRAFQQAWRSMQVYTESTSLSLMYQAFTLLLIRFPLLLIYLLRSAGMASIVFCLFLSLLFPPLRVASTDCSLWVRVRWQKRTLGLLGCSQINACSISKSLCLIFIETATLS